jgi:hypothetical protein
MNTLVKNALTSFAGLFSLIAACGSMAFSERAHAQAAPLDLIGGFEGIYSGWIPANPIIAAGPSSLVTMVSGRIAIFNKQGTKLFEQNLGAGGFWAGQGADLVVEPWVLFDPHSRRFFAIARDAGSNLGYVYLAVSKTTTPTGSADWNKYALDLSGTHQTSGDPTYPALPKAGADVQALYISTQHFNSHFHVVAIPKAPLLTGATANIVYEHTFLTWGPPHPALVFDPLSPMYFVTQDPNFETVTVYALTDVLTTPQLSETTMDVAAFDQPPDVPQLGGSLLASVGSRFLSGVVRNGSLWTAHHISDPAVDGEALVRWYQFDVSGFPGDTTLAQSGYVDPGPGIHACYPAVNVDADGNMGLTCSISGASQYVAIGYTGRRATDPDGFTLPVQTARAGEGAYTQGGWGGYCGLAIDPDDYTFWLFNQYPIRQKGNSGAWRTLVGAFELVPPAPPSNPLHCVDLDGSPAIQSSSKWRATVVVTMHDGNDDPVQGASVSVRWSTGATGTGTTDANGQCTFTLSNLSRQSTPSVTLTITNATHATLNYDAGANDDSDGDSNGTSITVIKP